LTGQGSTSEVGGDEPVDKILCTICSKPLKPAERWRGKYNRHNWCGRGKKSQENLCARNPKVKHFKIIPMKSTIINININIHIYINDISVNINTNININPMK